jgi:hypothetical protein
MQRLVRTVMSHVVGAFVCALLGGAVYVIMALADGASGGEAFLHGAMVGVVGALAGAVIGFIVGVGNLNALGGAAAGLLATVVLVALYVLSFARPGQIGYFRGMSVSIVIVFSLPAVLTAIITVLLMKLFALTLPPNHQPPTTNLLPLSDL